MTIEHRQGRTMFANPVKLSGETSAVGLESTCYLFALLTASVFVSPVSLTNSATSRSVSSFLMFRAIDSTCIISMIHRRAKLSPCQSLCQPELNLVERIRLFRRPGWLKTQALRKSRILEQGVSFFCRSRLVAVT